MKILVTFLKLSLVVAMAVPLWLGGRADAGLSYAGPDDLSAASLPVTPILPVVPIDDALATNGASPGSRDPNEVLGGILANSAPKPGATAILSDITKVRFAGGSNDLAGDPTPTASSTHTGWWVGLGITVVGLGVAVMGCRWFIRRAGLGNAIMPADASMQNAENQSARKLDPARLI